MRTVILQDAYHCCVGSFSQTVNNSVLAVSEGLPGQWALLMGILNIFASPAALTKVLEERRQRERMSENVFLMVRRERTDMSE